jgi:SpoVK/Ycf46/Vps4 family AAA+-type ATPase
VEAAIDTIDASRSAVFSIYESYDGCAADEEEESKPMGYTQWTTLGDGSFAPVGKTVRKIKPGYYDLATSNQGQIVFIPVHGRKDKLLKFPDSASKAVLEEIAKFWEREAIFKKYELAFKRGILLYGPPGSGKTCTFELVARDIVQRGGIVLTFNPAIFLNAYRALREIQPEIPVVVLMEDFEATIENYDESRILNLLDGVEQLHKVVFLASTNYPERLAPRVMNRPSRFDVTVHVPHPCAEARKIYLETLLRDDPIDVTAYVKATDGMSLAHVKELFAATVILGVPFAAAVDRLEKMRDEIVSSDDDVARKQVGFGLR